MEGKNFDFADWIRDGIATIAFTVLFVGLTVFVLNLNTQLDESKTLSPLSSFQREEKSNTSSTPETLKFSNTTTYESSALTCTRNNCVWSGGICNCSRVQGARTERSLLEEILKVFLSLK